ncbi:MAG: serpin family protein [Bacteroidia bacterium]|jgi:serpin B
MKRITFLSLSTLFAFAHCSNKKQNAEQTLPTQENMKTEELPAPQSSVVAGNNLFANDLLKNYLTAETQKNKNIFFSSFSIYSALAMTSEGAKGQTEKEMHQVLHLTNDEKTRHSEMNALTTALNPATADYKLSVVNALWAQKGYSFLNKFTTVNTENYKAQIENLDFIQQPDNALKTINTWVESKTNNKIKDLLSPNHITKNTRLILTNAVYFKADWARPFEAEYTQDKDFTTASGEKVKAKMMRQVKGFNYAETNEAQIVELPYKGRELSMVLILPKKGQTISSVAAVASNFNQKGNGELVRVILPKFKVEAKYTLKEDLIKMGMSTPFSDKADFSNMSDSKELLIGQVIHQTFVDVNETGTEAAAATAVSMEAGSAPRQPKEFNADRPFIFMIKHNTTGAVLFTGVLNDPTIQ